VVNRRPTTASPECCCMTRSGPVITWPCQSGTDWPTMVAGSLSDPVQISSDDVYGAYRPDHVIHQRCCNTNQPGPNSSPLTIRRLPGTENTDPVWRESILCGGWTVHMELSPRVSEKDWLYSRLLNTVWKRTFQRLPRLCCVLIFFHCFIDCCNARPVRLVVDLALSTVEHWTFCFRGTCFWWRAQHHVTPAWWSSPLATN